MHRDDVEPAKRRTASKCRRLTWKWRHGARGQCAPLCAWRVTR